VVYGIGKLGMPTEIWWRNLVEDRERGGRATLRLNVRGDGFLGLDVYGTGLEPWSVCWY
jgi:hypothetical protein